MASKAKQKRITVEDLWKIKRPSGLSLSPDGAQAVVGLTTYDMEENKGSSALWQLSTFGGEPRQLTQCGEKDGQAVWSPDGSLIAFVAKRGEGKSADEEPQLYVIAPDGGEAKRVTTLATGVSGIKWFGDGKRIACISWVWPDLKTEKAQAERYKARKSDKVKAHVIEHTAFRHWDHWLSDGRVPHVHVIDVTNGKCRDLFAGTRYELTQFDLDQHDYDISPDGKSIAFGFNPNDDKRDDQAREIVEIDIKTGKAKVLAKATRYNHHHPRYAPDGRTIAVLVNDYARSVDDDSKLAFIDCKTNRFSLAGSWDRLVGFPLKWSADSQSIYFTADEHSRVSVWRWQLGEKAPSIVAQGGTVAEFDIAADTMVFIRNNMSLPPKVFANVDGEERAIESFNDALMAKFKLGTVREFTVKGWHGEPVQMWAIYPPNFDEKKKWPLLHSIHGGPHANWGDNFHFRWNNHTFAAQGYVVVCVNYHGSLGWGNKFLESNNGMWGTKEHADVEAGTDFMLKQGYIDKHRLAATGGSYGGKMVAWMNGTNGAKKGGDRYKAYVCHAGCFDWRAMYASDATYYFDHELHTTYWADEKKFASQNPITHVKNAKTPTLVIHGALDYRVPDAQGLAYYGTLKSLSVPAKLLFYPDENHWILKPQNSRLWYREYFAWLEKYIGKRLKNNKRSRAD
jgi:dipeptidyl aminopeptidase/acylaminoacyl peptidase